MKTRNQAKLTVQLSVDGEEKLQKQSFSHVKADVTETNAETKALLKAFQIVGPPAILFFNKDGEELRPFRQVGFMPAEAFAAHVSKAVQ